MMLDAKQAKALSNQSGYNQVFNVIEKSAREGYTSVELYDVPKSAVRKLLSLGYLVTNPAPKTYQISWE